MTFKKTNIKKNNKNILNVVGIISIGIIFIFALYAIKNINLIKIDIDEKNKIELEGKKKDLGLKNSDLIDEDIKEVVTNSDNKLNLLLLGRGGGDHDAPNLTDTIILASINKDKKHINMLSIPRDLYVDYNSDTKDEKGKINGVYAFTSYEENSKEKGIEKLKSKITQITGEKIDYYANIDFNGFKEIIDTIGGVTLTLENNFIDNEYPDGNWGYTTLKFKKGTWLFDGESTLKYVRSRHSTSDFDRSKRQQQVISAIKEKLNGGYFFKSPSKIKELYDVLNKNIDTDIPLSEVIKIAYDFKTSGDYKILSSNINDTCFYGSNTCSKGGLLYVPTRDLFDGMSVLLLDGTDKFNLNNYKKSKIFSNIVINNSDLFTENYEINIFNSLKVNHLASALSNDFVKYGFNVPPYNSIGNTPKIFKKSVIYYNNIGEDSKTLKILKIFFKGEFVKTNFPKYSKNGAKIEVIIGEDYLGKKQVFNF